MACDCVQPAMGKWTQGAHTSGYGTNKVDANANRVETQEESVRDDQANARYPPPYRFILLG